MFDAWKSQCIDSNSNGYIVDVSKDMMRLALAVISGAGFGLAIPWTDDNTFE